jgi:hypothetical protein
MDFQCVGVGPKAEATNSIGNLKRYYWKVSQICPVDFQWVGVDPNDETTNSIGDLKRYYWKVGQICPCP